MDQTTPPTPPTSPIPRGFDADEAALLAALAATYPTADAALAEAAGLRATLGLPAPVIHLISDVHGEDAKLRHVVNNASGALRPLVADLLHGSLTDAEQRQLLSVIYYPAETIAMLRAELIDSGRRGEWVRRTLRLQFELVRQLSRSWRRGDVRALMPAAHAELFEELAVEPSAARPTGYVDTLIGDANDSDFDAVRAASRLVRNLSQAEIIVAGDLGDRGPRIDSVIEFLMRQPHTELLWGNHDAHWMGAVLGVEACIASVVRFSLRYGRTPQLEEGYGIPLAPLAALADATYGDTDVSHWAVKATGGYEAAQAARMQKAITVMLLKYEGRLMAEHPEWALGHRDLLPRVDVHAGTVDLCAPLGVVQLTDADLPTLVNGNEPTTAEAECMAALVESFVRSERLWRQMNWCARRGRMWLTRGEALVFHACVPVDAAGVPLALEVDGRSVAGRELMDALGAVVRRAFRKGAGRRDGDADWLWYLWAGPRSPLFGKDKIATFESHFVADKSASVEHKNPYFELIHDAAFVVHIGRLFGCGDDVLLVNGHVPVKIEAGEQPVKRGGNAVTIDGAFSEAYGDRGYSMLITPAGTVLAEHAHFQGVGRVVEQGADMLPRITTLRRYEPPRRRGDLADAAPVRRRIHELERLAAAYDAGVIEEGLAT